MFEELIVCSQHGGFAHPPKPRDWSTKLQKKVRALGLKIALSARLSEVCLADGSNNVSKKFFLPSDSSIFFLQPKLRVGETEPASRCRHSHYDDSKDERRFFPNVSPIFTANI